MIDFDDLRQALYQWATSVLENEQIIWYYPNAPRPSTYYTTLYLNNVLGVGQDFVSQPTSESSDVLIIGNREFTLTVQSYGGNALSRMETIRSSLQKPSIQASLLASNIVFVSSGTVIDLTQVMNTGYETRAAIDIRFRVAQSQQDSAGIIQAIEGNYSYDNDGEQIIGTYAFGDPYNP